MSGSWGRMGKDGQDGAKQMKLDTETGQLWRDSTTFQRLDAVPTASSRGCTCSARARGTVRKVLYHTRYLLKGAEIPMLQQSQFFGTVANKHRTILYTHMACMHQGNASLSIQGVQHGPAIPIIATMPQAKNHSEEKKSFVN
jgi:hypothetical protein